MDNIYLYNDTFIGLLNLITKLYENNIRPKNIKPLNYSPTLFENLINLYIEIDKNIINKVINKIGNINFKIIYTVYLSNNINKELIIFYYYINSLKYKNNLQYMRNLKCVTVALKINKYVKNEAHKYKGFVRFKELKNNILYAEIEPVNNIIYLIANHFKNRLNNEYWIIKDINRNIFCLYDRKEIFFTNEENFQLITNQFTNNELDYQNLWKNFYKIIGIESRKNDRCRMNFMPKRYWKQLIEMSDEM